MTDFKTIPTAQQLASKIIGIHTELHKLAEAVGLKIAETEQNIVENNALTDTAIEEINLKLAFLMTNIAVRRPLNAGLAGADGKVQYETKPAIQVYMETGRQKMIEEREAFLRAQSASSAEAAAGNGATTETAVPEDDPTNPSGVTH